MIGHVLYLVGGAPRVGKSSLAQQLLPLTESRGCRPM
jgi:GTP1/Obg family GTP-binding protein